MKRNLSRPDAEIIELFSKLRSRRDVADLLEVPLKVLVWHLYRFPAHRQYRTFWVPKADGSRRKVDAPNTTVKILQKKLLHILTLVYRPSRPVSGFVRGRDIRTNAAKHRSKSWVLNIDLKDFFPSIHFGRVRGMLMAKPYSLGEEAASTIAHLACWQGVLPQGSPSSPILANMVCARLDSQLMALSRRFRCDYSRYADDLTFSTNTQRFPELLAANVFNGEHLTCVVGDALKAAISSNGFELKPEKSRLRGYWQRQEVTGLVVNSRIGVNRKFARSLRSALHCWEKHGIAEAEARWRSTFDLKRGSKGREFVSFERFIGGRLSYIEHINGVEDRVVVSLRQQFDRLTGAPTTLDALVVIEVDGSDGPAQGTGFWLKGVGLVTCAHVVENASDIRTKAAAAGGEWLTAMVKWKNDLADIAVLLAKNTAKHHLHAHSIDQEIGAKVTVIGYPSASDNHTHFSSTGSIVQKKTHMEFPVYLVDADIVSGTSGGPVIDGYGRVLGVARSGEKKSGVDHLQEKSVVPIATVLEINSKA